MYYGAEHSNIIVWTLTLDILTFQDLSEILFLIQHSYNFSILFILSSPAEIIAALQQTLSFNHHLILKQKYDVVVEGGDIKNADISPEDVVQYCKDLLPIICKLDGDLSLHKGKVALKLAKTQLEIFRNKFKEKSMSKEELMKQSMPYLKLQVDAKKLIY